VVAAKLTRAWSIGFLIAAGMLSGCATTSGDCTPCNPDERFPPGLVRFAEKHIDRLEGTRRTVRYRSGRLEGSVEAVQYVASLARSGDVLASTNRGTLTAQLIPGYFTHSAAIVGTPAELRQLGIWDHPAIRPLQPRIAAGEIVIEATNEGVHLSKLEVFLDTDRVLLARPGGGNGLSAARRRDIVLALVSRLGTPFDLHFDASTDDALFCVELLQRAIPEVDLPLETIYGRPTIKPVAIADAVFRTSAPLGFVAYLKGGKGGFQGVSKADLQAELQDARRLQQERAGCGGAQETGRAAKR
jgi:hypothetical protein